MKNNHGYEPTGHRVKVLYSVRLTPAQLEEFWKRERGAAPFSIRGALNLVRLRLEVKGIDSLKGYISAA